MAAAVGILVGVVFFYFWITGHWIPALLTVIPAVVVQFSRDIVLPWSLLLPVIAAAPYAIRHYLINPAPRSAWGIEVRAVSKPPQA